MSHDTPTTATSSLPIVVQLGFAGARNLLDTSAHPDVDPAAFEAAVEQQLAGIVADLPAQLGLGPQHFLCGISQIAIGGDTIFTRACRDGGLVQRIFLTQTVDEYLHAKESSEPDFTAAQREVATGLLASPHVIQQRVVSDASNRTERFQDANLEIIRVTDVVIVLVRDNQKARPGGSHQMLALAEKRGLPALEIVVGVADGAPTIDTRWIHRERFHPPGVPTAIVDAALAADAPSGLPDMTAYGHALYDLGSKQAGWQRKFFTWAATIIILAHILATVIAVIAMKVHGGAIAWLLGGELVLLALGFGTHQFLHGCKAVERWALSRLVAEVARSVAAIGSFHIYLHFLFVLPFPTALRHVLRTVSVLHLRSTAGATGEQESWERQRDDYLHERLMRVEPMAQIHYNERTREKAGKKLQYARRVFVPSSVMAFVATLLKLLVLCHVFHMSHHTEEIVVTVLGALAILLPVVAVASLSLASAFDLEARYHISDEMAKFLHTQRVHLENASTRREYARLLLETETRLLGETVNWYARRTFLGIA